MAKVAVVSGGTRGIGAAISKALQAAGYTAVANYAGTSSFRRLWCKLSQPTQRSALEHYAAYAARTAFQIPGAVLPLMRSFPSLN